jgi:hypothetical protein
MGGQLRILLVSSTLGHPAFVGPKLPNAADKDILFFYRYTHNTLV